MADPWDNDTPVAHDEPAQQEAAPWDQDTPIEAQATAASTAAQSSDAPWENDKPATESSLPGAISRDVAEEAPGFAGGLAGAAAGAAAGALTPIPGGALIGGVVGAMGGGYLTDRAKDMMLEKFGIRRGHGWFSDEQRQADIQQHPLAKDIADVGMTAATFGFNPAAGIGQRLLSGGLMGGIETAQQAAQGEFDPSEIALRTAEGLVFTDARKYTKAFMRPFEQAGAAAGARVFKPGRPDTAAPNADQDKADVDRGNDLTTVARGVAAENTPPPERVNIGNDQNPPERSEREYPKENAQQAQPQVTSGLMTPDQMAALERSSVRNQTEGPPQIDPTKLKGEEPAPIDTGLARMPVEGLNGKPPAEPLAPPDVAHMNDEELVDASKAQRERAQQLAPPAADITTAPGPRYKNPEYDGMFVDRNLPVPGVARLKGNTIFIDRNVPPSIDVNGKPLDPAIALSVREKSLQDALATQREVDPHGRVGREFAMQAARETQMDNFKHWAEQRGYDFDALQQRLTELNGSPLTPERVPEKPRINANDLEGLKGGEEAMAQAAPEDVTATVTRPKAVDLAVEELRARGMNDAAEAVDQHTNPEEQAQLATKALRALRSRTGEPTNLKHGKDYAQPRVPAKPAEASNGVTARTLADAERIDRSLLASKRGFEKAATEREFDPGNPEDVAALRAQLKGALEFSRTYNNGKLPTDTYKPVKARDRGQGVQEPPASWLWARDADKFLKGRMSAQEFIANDKLYRSGNPEDARMARDTGRIQSDMELRRTPQAEDAAQETAVPGTEKDIETAADLDTLDLSKLKPEQEDKLIADTSTLMDNVVKTYEAKASDVPAYQREAEAVAARTGKLRRARESLAYINREAGKPLPKSEGKASEGRHVDLTPEIKQAALDAIKKAEKGARDYSRLDPLAADVAKESEKNAKEFFGDESGAVNFNKVNGAFKAKLDEVRGAMNKYFGVTVNEVQRHVDPILASVQSTWSKLSAEKSHLLDARWHQWNKQSKENRWNYLDALEGSTDKWTHADYVQALKDRGLDPKTADWMADEALFHRDLMDKIYETDKLFVKNYERLEGYVQHQFTDPKGVQEWLANRPKPIGTTGFTKERVFDTIREAEAAGFKLKYSNPIDIVNARWAQSIRDWTIVGGLRKMMKDGYAYPYADPNTPKYAKDNYIKLGNTPDGLQWVIAPEAQHLWKNAMEAASLHDRQDVWGSAYRTWMKVKNIWMPIQLGLSLFHEVHVAMNINPVQNFVRAMRVAHGSGDWAGELSKAFKSSISDPLFALPLDKVFGGRIDNFLGNRFSEFEGRKLMDMWSKNYDDMSTEERMWSHLISETGSQLEQNIDTISAERALAAAWEDRRYPSVAGNAIRRGIQYTQDWMMKYQIPALKAIAIKRQIEAAFKLDPSLATNESKRRIVMREIGKNIDDRYGEMFYKSLFWNRYLKDAGVGSMLSLSWNLGQVRQFSGALHDIADMARIKANGTINAPARRIAVEGGDRAAFVSGYIAMSMLTAGGLSWALSGQFPSGLDYVFPRNGANNPDGSPARLTVPFNTREAPMLIGHIQQQDSVLGGLWHLLYNKMIIAPIVEAANNRDFFGRELYDTHAPWYQRAVQAIDSELEHLNPISFAGSKTAESRGGGARDKALAYAGFGPSAAYVAHDAIQNRISQLYYDQRGPRPYEYGPKTGLGRGLVQGTIRSLANDPTQGEARQEGYAKINRGHAIGDQELTRQGRKELIEKGGMSAKTAGTTLPNEQFQRMYKDLPIQHQAALFRRMDDEQKKYYVYRNRFLGGTGMRKVLRAAGQELPSR